MKKNTFEPPPAAARGRPGIPAKHRERQEDCGPASESGNGTVGAEKIGQCIAYMKQHLDKPLQVSTLTALVGVSPSHFFALFKHATGHTPIDFFIHLRMHRACELLQKTGLCVKEVAASLGYEDQFYFSRIFKAVNRVAPSEYRVRLAGYVRTKKTAVLTHMEKKNLEESRPRLPALEPLPVRRSGPENAPF
jgi:transcriptional regulator GlxA family with amidase domain